MSEIFDISVSRH